MHEVFSGLALGGLQALLMQVDWLYMALKVAGGAYLVYLGIRLWRGARTPLAVAADDGRPATGGWRRSFVVGLATQLSNPKTAIWYASIFAAFLPAQIPVWMFWALPPLTFAVEMGWYTIVAVLFSSSRPRAFYLRGKHCGQVGQPRPDAVTRTIAPVTAIPPWVSTTAAATSRCVRRLGMG
ncbi:MAG: hypothetical protein QOK12_3638, partial [Mycobacterium sp.]|nr:hypothetical protein [Mycobacterium sp.]